MADGKQLRVAVTKDNHVFASAHFITFPGHRCETLHGHNYRTHVAVEGSVDPEAHYVVDFSELKQLMKRLTDEIDHKVLLPLQNPKIQIREDGDSVAVAVNGRPRYVFPKADCALLPIPNTTVEMLAQYLAGRVSRERTPYPGVKLRAIEIEVEENFGQSATYRESLECRLRSSGAGPRRPTASRSARFTRPSCSAVASSAASHPASASRWRSSRVRTPPPTRSSTSGSAPRIAFTNPRSGPCRPPPRASSRTSSATPPPATAARASSSGDP